MKRTILILMLGILMTGFAAAQPSTNLITSNSVGNIKLGMTVAQVRKAVAPMKIERTSDGEGVALIGVMKGNDAVMTLYAGEEDRDAPLDRNARIEQIWVFGSNYRTAKGVHPGMMLADAEKKYGKVKTVTMSEIESREFAEFSDHPSGMDFRVLGKNDNAGAYPKGSRSASSYNPGAYVFAVMVTGRDGSTTGIGSDFSSEYTDLKTGCKTSGGNEGGHVSHFCPGPGDYQIHYFDAATAYQINAATKDREWEEPLQMIGLDKLDAIGNVEWRLADGKPFAVLVRTPGTDAVIVRGLKGFERIKYEESGSGAVERARSMADNDYGDVIVPSTRLKFASGSNTATVNGHLKNIRDKLKYVINAKAGDRLTVRIEAKKWAGDEGPVMVGIVTTPDGKGGGGPGGTVFDEVLTQTGDHEILVYQNAAKSQTKEVDVAVTVTLLPGKEQSLGEIAAPFLPNGAKPIHEILKGDFGGSKGNIVALYGKDAPAVSYDGLVLIPKGPQFEKFDLPRPEFTWSIEEPKAVFYADADSDRDLELFIIGECYTGIGPTGAQPFYRTRVYDWNGSRFDHMESLSDEIGRLGTAPSIKGQLTSIIKRAEARPQTMDADAMNETLDQAKAKTPMQILALLLDPFDEMLSRTVTIKADSVEAPDSLAIVVTDDGYADDSVRGAQYKFKLTRNVDGNWRVSTASKGWSCQPGRGHRDYSSKPCS
jgi:hypothetical protein